MSISLIKNWFTKYDNRLNMSNKEIKVRNCYECPFQNENRPIGNWCTLKPELKTKERGYPSACPLIDSSQLVSLATK